VNSKISQRTLGKLRDQIRINQFNHQDFNPFYGSKAGKHYFKGALWKERSASENSKYHDLTTMGSSSTLQLHKGKPLIPKVPLLDEHKVNMLDVIVPFHKKYAPPEPLSTF